MNNGYKSFLFHGTLDIFSTPDLSRGRDHIDFGKGFYTTPIREQAEIWANKKANKKQRQIFYVNAYELDIKELASDTSIKTISFLKPNEKWLDLILNCRIYNKQPEYDIIVGPVADDNVIKSLNYYINQAKIITSCIINPETLLLNLKQDTVKQLINNHNYEQHVFLSEKALRYLKFLERFSYKKQISNEFEYQEVQRKKQEKTAFQEIEFERSR